MYTVLNRLELAYFMSDFNQFFFSFSINRATFQAFQRHHGFQLWHQNDAILTSWRHRRDIFSPFWRLFHLLASRDIHNLSTICRLTFYHNVRIGPESDNKEPHIATFLSIFWTDLIDWYRTLVLYIYSRKTQYEYESSEQVGPNFDGPVQQTQHEYRLYACIIYTSNEQ